MRLKIVAFSDTHGSHKKIEIPECDLCIFAGDLSSIGNRYEVDHFLKWYNNQHQCLYKIFIAGNHDRSFDSKYENETRASEWLPQLFSRYGINQYGPGAIFSESIFYLENSSVEIQGLKIWGSPESPWFHGDYWAFNKACGEEIKAVWDTIPEGTDIVVTHTPMFGVLDYYDNQFLGCEDLRNRLLDIKPAMHICGHIHENNSMIDYHGITVINAGICDNRNYVRYKPILTEIEVS